MIRVYNTLTQQKEPLQTVQPGRVGMYVCGPTVYSPSHVGHMVGPVIFDTIKKYLVYSGYEVTWVVNITDVDDKLIVAAQKEGTTVRELAERVQDLSLGLHELGIRRGDRVAILSENRPEWAMTDYACLAARAADVPIYPTLPARQAEYILRDSGAVALVVSTAAQLEKVRGVRARLPFRAFVLPGPGTGSRLVVDVGHQWCATGHRDC